MKNFGQVKKITTDVTKSYLSAFDALKDLGYNEEGIYESQNLVSNKWTTRVIFSDTSGKLWAFYGMYNYNTTIYSIFLKRFLGTI